MKVVVPYRSGMLSRRTHDAARAWQGGCEFVCVRNADESAGDGYRPTYSQLLADLWEAGDDVLILEQDVVPYEDSLASIAYCPEPWCGYQYPAGGRITKVSCNLGCTKLSARLIAATAAFGEAERRQRTWDRCDARLSGWVCARAGIRPHRHYPDVAHRVGSDYIDLDGDGRPLGEPREAYAPLRNPELAATPIQDETRVGPQWLRDQSSSLAEAYDKMAGLNDLFNPSYRDDQGVGGMLDVIKQIVPPPLTTSRSLDLLAGGAAAAAQAELKRLRLKGRNAR